MPFQATLDRWVAFGIAVILLTVASSQVVVGQTDVLPYPEAARRAGIQGAVVLKLRIDEAGKVVGSTVLSGPSALAEYSQENVGIWFYGRGGKSRTDVVVFEYRIEDGLCHDGSSSLTIWRHPGLVSIVTCREVEANAASPTASPRVGSDGGQTAVVHFEDLHSPVVAMALLKGVVVLELTLDDKGSVTHVTPLRGPKSLVTEASANAKKWAFRPNADRRTYLVYEFSRDSGACRQPIGSVFMLRYPNFASILHCTQMVELGR